MAPHNEGTELGWVGRFKVAARSAFCEYIGEPCVYMADWYVENFLATINYVLFGAMHWFLYQIFVSTSSDKLFRNLLNLLFWVVCKFVLLSIKYPVKALGLAAVVSGVCLENDKPESHYLIPHRSLVCIGSLEKSSVPLLPL